MRIVPIEDAKAQLTHLVENLSHGEAFLISKDGKPVVRVEPLVEPTKPARKLGFLRGKIEVPDDFDTMFADEIEEMFYGKK